MENKKDIGKAFREKLDGLEKAPGNAVWESLSAELRQKKKKRFVLPFWLRTIVIPLLLIVVAGMATYPLWKNSLPTIRVEMPEEEKAGAESSKDSENGVTQAGTSSETGTPTGVGNGTRDVITSSADGEITSDDRGSNNRNNTDGSVANSETGLQNQAADGNTDRAASRNAPKGPTGPESAGREDAVGLGGRKAKDNSQASSPVNTAGKAGRNPDSRSQTEAGQAAVDGKADIRGARKTNVKDGHNTNASGTAGDAGSQNDNHIARFAAPDTLNAIQTGNSDMTVGAKKVRDRSKTSVNETPRNAPVKVSVTEVLTTKEDSLELLVAVNTRRADAKNYGADTLVIKSGQKVDFSKVADSLNKLYGRDKKKEGEEKKKKLREKVTDIPRDTTPYKQLYVYGYYSLHGFEPPSTGKYLGGGTAANNGTTIKKSSGYGAYVGYNFNSRLGVRAGIRKSGLEITTNNVVLKNTYVDQPADADHPEPWTETVRPRNFSRVAYATGVNNNIIRQELALRTDSNGQDSTSVNIRHDISFFEIPLELTYRFKAGKFGFGAFGGVSMRQLKENKVFASNSIGTIYLGKHKGLEKTTFTAGLGISLKYEVYEGLQVNVEPSIRYGFGKQQFIGPQSYMLAFGLQYNFDLFDKRK